MNKKIRVGFFSRHNYFDKNSFSGTLYNMYKALEDHVELINLGNPQKINLFNKIRIKILSKLGKLEIQDEEFYRKFIDIVHNQLLKKPCDLIYAPVASKELSFLQTDLPIVYFSDATPNLIGNGYQIYRDEEDYLLACQREKISISKAHKIIYSSEWVAKSAIKDYGADPNIIDIIPLGANVQSKPEASKTLHKTFNSTCNLLFIGKDWERKGGKIAIETLTSLINMGVDAELFIVGCQPPSEIKHKKIHVLGFLDKNIPSEAKRFSELLLNSNFLLLPTRSDCSPIVIVEANAYGVPVLTTDVGGIPTIIKNGKNGYMLTLSAKGHEYAKIISDVFTDKVAYQNMIQNSRKEYDDRLNWDKWGEKMHQIFLNMMERRV